MNYSYRSPYSPYTYKHSAFAECRDVSEANAKRNCENAKRIEIDRYNRWLITGQR